MGDKCKNKHNPGGYLEYARDDECKHYCDGNKEASKDTKAIPKTGTKNIRRRNKDRIRSTAAG